MLVSVGYGPEPKTVHTRTPGNDLPSGSINVGTFEHPNETYPDSYVIYHGVRDLLYKRSEANPANAAKFPKNITDMAAITIKES